MGFQRLLHTETGRIIISIVLGLGIASLFRKVCKDRSCISFRAPPLKDLEKDTYKLDDKCYEYKTKAVKCEPGKKEVKLHWKIEYQIFRYRNHHDEDNTERRTPNPEPRTPQWNSPLNPMYIHRISTTTGIMSIEYRRSIRMLSQMGYDARVELEKTKCISLLPYSRHIVKPKHTKNGCKTSIQTNRTSLQKIINYAISFTHRRLWLGN